MNDRIDVGVSCGTTVERLIKMYLFKIGGTELINNYYSKKVKIKFFFNAVEIKFGEKTLVEKYFRNFLVDVKVFQV